MKELRIRAADASDGAVLGELTTIAADGLLDAVLGGLVPQQTPAQLMSRIFRTGNSTYSWKNATVAEVAGEPAGMLLAYPAKDFNPTDNDGEIPPERLQMFRPLEQLKPSDGYYVSALAVYPDFRSSGIASKLLAHAREEARSKGFDSISLHVFEHNDSARRLYEKEGFKAVGKVKVEESGRQDHVVLMVNDLKDR